MSTKAEMQYELDGLYGQNRNQRDKIKALQAHVLVMERGNRKAKDAARYVGAKYQALVDLFVKVNRS